MEVLSFITLILFSLVGYSGGAVSKARNFQDLKPKIIDLVIVMLIWAGAVYSKLAFDLDNWLLILIWIFFSSLIGLLAVWSRRLSKEREQSSKNLEAFSIKKSKNLWRIWKDFSYRMGIFQSRIILSLFFFILVSPFALALKIFF